MFILNFKYKLVIYICNGWDLKVWLKLVEEFLRKCDRIVIEEKKVIIRWFIVGNERF